jgi:hypothetical protein
LDSAAVEHAVGEGDRVLRVELAWAHAPAAGAFRVEEGEHLGREAAVIAEPMVGKSSGTEKTRPPASQASGIPFRLMSGSVSHASPTPSDDRSEPLRETPHMYTQCVFM